MAIDRTCAGAPTSAALLADVRRGSQDALDALLPLVYAELYRIARRELHRRPCDTLSATALVSEMYLRVAGTPSAAWRDRSHFLALATVAMRYVLVDRARARLTAKRAARYVHASSVDDVAAPSAEQTLLEVHDALDWLADVDPRLARVVECRFFGGLSERETAELLHVTERTVRRDWVKARALLCRSLAMR